MALLERARGSMPRGVPMAWMDDLYEHPPVWISHGEGSSFTDVDGYTYLDMYVADMSAFCGHAPPPVVEAVAERIGLGNQFLLPAEDAIVVAEHLAGRYGMAKWQFTLSATQANTEVIRLARELTGREIVLLFDGKYHGEGDATLVISEGGGSVPESRGLPPGIAAQTRIVQFNDVSALEAALAPGDVALVLAEPAMTNAGFLLPAPDTTTRCARRRATPARCSRSTRPTASSAPTAASPATGGSSPTCSRSAKRSPRACPLATYGMREQIAALIAPPEDARVVSGAFVDEVATGGTLFAQRPVDGGRAAALLEVLTEEAFERTAALGKRMAAGLRTAIERAGLRVERGPVRRARLLLLRRGPAHRRRRVARRRRSGPASPDPRVHGQPRRLGVGVVAGADGLGRPLRRRRRPLPRRLRAVPRRGHLRRADDV